MGLFCHFDGGEISASSSLNTFVKVRNFDKGITQSCHLDGGEITLETPHRISPIFVELRMRSLLRRDDKAKRLLLTKL